MNRPMRNRYLAIASVVGVLALARSCALRNNQANQKRASSPGPPELQDSPAQLTTAGSISPVMSGRSNPPATLQNRQFLSAFATPIEFYGKVIDQNGQPVSAASVKFVANDKPTGGRPSQFKTETDNSGNFSLTNVAGLTLAVDVSKPGYRPIPPEYGRVTSSGVFDYGLSSAKGPHRPDRANPIVFRLHKYGPQESLVRIEEKHFRIARDGSPLSIPLDRTPSRNHEVVLRCWNTETQGVAEQKPYDWSFEIIVAGGGLVRRNDELDFQAPESGYTARDQLAMTQNLPANQWQSFAALSYFIRFNDGIFARADIRIRAAGDHFVVWQSYLNPSGSRNLEYDPAKAIKPK
jgi:hypothetical protein